MFAWTLESDLGSNPGFADSLCDLGRSVWPHGAPGFPPRTMRTLTPTLRRWRRAGARSPGGARPRHACRDEVPGSCWEVVCAPARGGMTASWMEKRPASRPCPPPLEASSSSSEFSSCRLPFGYSANERLLPKGFREHRSTEENYSLPNHCPNKAETEVLKADEATHAPITFLY